MLELPIIFRPEKETNFVRLGRNNDGGYIVPVDAAKDSSLLLSFGLDDDWLTCSIILQYFFYLVYQIQ